MSCFWDSLFKKCKHHEWKSARDIVPFMKRKNINTPNVTINDEKLSFKQQCEHYIHVKNIKENEFRRGYYASMCDPVLCLLCRLLGIGIDHEWNLHGKKYIVKYRHTTCKRIITLYSDKGHAW